jgi:hypothetical protein
LDRTERWQPSRSQGREGPHASTPPVSTRPPTGDRTPVH